MAWLIVEASITIVRMSNVLLPIVDISLLNHALIYWPILMG